MRLMFSAPGTCSSPAGPQVERIITASSGAAYGYHADNPALLIETDPLRGNPGFAYAHHKRLVEEMLADWRHRHPELQQGIFRPGTTLGATTSNQITDLFERRFVLGLRGAEVPFVFIWDQDVVGASLRGQSGTRPTGSSSGRRRGTDPGRDRRGSRQALRSTPGLAGAGALATLKLAGLTQYGPEQVDFRDRPVLDNTLLKTAFGYTPELTTAGAFDHRTARMQDSER